MSESKTFIDKLFDLINTETKQGIEFLTASLYLVISLLFTHFFIAPMEVFKTIPEYLLYPAVFILLYSLKFFLYSSDILYDGDPEKNIYAKAFQAKLPSKFLVKKYKLSESRSKYIWYEKFFNQCSDPKHYRHSQWKRSFKRGYSCRAVFHTIKFLELIIVTSIIVLIVKFVVSIIPYNLGSINIKLQGQLTFLLVLFLIYFAIRIRNRTNERYLSGVWKQFEEINEINTQWIQEELKGVTDLDDYDGPTK